MPEKPSLIGWPPFFSIVSSLFSGFLLSRPGTFSAGSPHSGTLSTSRGVTTHRRKARRVAYKCPVWPLQRTQFFGRHSQHGDLSDGGQAHLPAEAAPTARGVVRPELQGDRRPLRHDREERFASSPAPAAARRDE